MNRLTLRELERNYKNCELCDLHKSRKKVVFGWGFPHSKVLLVAERPVRNDEATGIPFSGSAGELLDKILAAPKVEIPKSDAYLTNVVLCRAPNDRSPRVSEIRSCHDRLITEIELVDPTFAVAMGRLPMLHLLNLQGKLEELRGWYVTQTKDKEYKTFLTFNPASALYGDPETIKAKKKMMYQDWQIIGDAYRDTVKDI